MGQPRPRFNSIDLLRGIACLQIVLLHSTMVSIAAGRQAGGWNPFSLLVLLTSRMAIGVPIFFVISGYCIAAAADKQPGIGRYFLNRLRRIYPPYLIALGLTVAFSWLVVGCIGPGVMYPDGGAIRDYRELSWTQWIGNLTLTEEWRWHVYGSARKYVMVVAWSLVYEEQFYIVMGVLLLSRWLFSGAALVTVGCAVVAVLVPAESIKGFWFDWHWFTFAAGILLYWDLAYRRCWCWPAYLALVVMPIWHNPTGALMLRTPHPTAETGLAVAGLTCLLLWGVYRWDAQITGSRWARPLKWLGVRCYSLYLVHSPIVTVLSKLALDRGLKSDAATICVTVPVCVGASLGAAAVFHRWVERRFLSKSAGGHAPDLRRPDSQPYPPHP